MAIPWGKQQNLACWAALIGDHDPKADVVLPGKNDYGKAAS